MTANSFIAVVDKTKLDQGLKQALVSRGKNKGFLKKQCPPVGTLGSSVWQALVSLSNPYKVGMGHMLCMSDDGKDLYDYIIQCSRHVDLTTFDRDANTLRRLGVEV